MDNGGQWEDEEDQGWWYSDMKISQRNLILNTINIHENKTWAKKEHLSKGGIKMDNKDMK